MAKYQNDGSGLEFLQDYNPSSIENNSNFCNGEKALGCAPNIVYKETVLKLGHLGAVSSRGAFL